MSNLPKVDIDQPKFDQSTYIGRAKHFFLLTNPLNLLATGAQLERARRIVHDYRAGKPVTDVKSLDDLWQAKYLYDSAFHPETGEKSLLIGRMSAQMPMNTLITGFMLSFHKSNSAVIFWQWFNQTFNAIVNYTNRSGSSLLTPTDLLKSYCMATSGALATALTLNRVVVNMNPLFGRWVPFVAVAAANCINIPMMRIHELRNGVVLMNEKDQEVGISRRAAAIGISAVIMSRIFMAIPGMTITPIVVNDLEKKGFFKKYPKANVPIQMGLVAFMLIFATPLGCAFFRQRAILKVSSLEPEVQEAIKKKYPDLQEIWFNKGL